MDGLVVHTGLGSFAQVNNGQAAVLYAEVLRLLGAGDAGTKEAEHARVVFVEERRPGVFLAPSGRFDQLIGIPSGCRA